MTMVPSGVISLGGNATSTVSGPQSGTFIVDSETYYGTTVVGYDQSVFPSQATISPSTTTVAGGTQIIAVLWTNSDTLTLEITPAPSGNSGWTTMTIGANTFTRTAATYSSGSWGWTGVGNPFPAAGDNCTVSFPGTTGGPTITYNESAEIELKEFYGNNAAGTTTISLGDSEVRVLGGVPSGAISMSNLYGKTGPFQYSYTLANGQFAEEYNLNTALNAAGWNGVSPVIATVTINGTLGSGSPDIFAFDTGAALPAGSTVTVTVGSTGYITGAGGDGTGPSGGNAMYIEFPITLNNSGIIQGGGGGGAFGDDSYRGGGAGYLPSNGQGGGNFGGPSATLTSGSGFAHDSSGGSNNGGAGGGWVAVSGAPSSNGMGNGSPGEGDNSGPLNGGQKPGAAITGWSNVLNSSSFTPSPVFVGPQSSNGYTTNPNSHFRGAVQ